MQFLAAANLQDSICCRRWVARLRAAVALPVVQPAYRRSSPRRHGSTQVRISGRDSAPFGMVLAVAVSAATSWETLSPTTAQRPGRIAGLGVQLALRAASMLAITDTRALAAASPASQEGRRMARAPMPLPAASARLPRAVDLLLAYLARSRQFPWWAGLHWPQWPLTCSLAETCLARPRSLRAIRLRTLF